MTNNNRPKLSSVDAAGLGAALLLTMIYILGVASPLWVHHGQVAIQNNELAVQKDKARQLTLEVRALNAELATVHLAVAKSPLKLESEDQLNNRLAGITALSKKCGLDIQEIVPGSSIVGQRYNTVSIHMTGHGNYRACVSFLHQLHQHYLDTSIRGFRLSGDPRDSAAPLSIEFDVLWFARPASVAQTE